MLKGVVPNYIFPFRFSGGRPVSLALLDVVGRNVVIRSADFSGLWPARGAVYGPPR